MFEMRRAWSPPQAVPTSPSSWLENAYEVGGIVLSSVPVGRSLDVSGVRNLMGFEVRVPLVEVLSRTVESLRATVAASP